MKFADVILVDEIEGSLHHDMLTELTEEIADSN